MNENAGDPLVFVVDDDDAVRKAVSRSVAAAGVSVESFSSAQECIGALKKNVCHLLITDFNMPKMNGIELVARAKKLQPLLPVIVVTGFGEIQLAVKAIKCGASEFVEKPLDEESFIPLIKNSVRCVEKADSLHGQALTEAELKVLTLVAEGKVNKEIAYELDRSIRTVENHRHRIGRKLNVSSTAELVKIAIGLGLTAVESE